MGQVDNISVDTSIAAHRSSQNALYVAGQAFYDLRTFELSLALAAALQSHEALFASVTMKVV